MRSDDPDDLDAAMHARPGLAAYARLVGSRPWVFLASTLLISALLGWIAVQRLTLDANTDSLIRSDRPFMKEYQAFLAEFGDLEYLYVAVDSKGNSAAARATVDELAPRLASIASLREVHATISASEQWRMAPRALATSELEELAGAKDGFAPFGSDASAVSVATAAANTLDRLLRDGLSMDAAARERAGAAAIFQLESLLPGDDERGSLNTPLSPKYLESSSGLMYFVEILPDKDFGAFETIDESLRAIRGVIDEVAPHHPRVEIGLTGKPVLQADELATSNRDMMRGTLAAAIIIALLTVWLLRSAAPALLATLSLGLGFACTYGAAAILVGRLNLLSLVFMLVLVSAGIDYGIHLVARYTEFKERMNPERALVGAIVTNTLPIWTGALTSAAVFFTAVFTDFGGLIELGVIAGTGLLICAAVMTTALPASILIYDRWRARRGGAHAARRHAEDRRAEMDSTAPCGAPPSRAARLHSGWTLAGCAGAIGLLGALIPALRFESNLLHMQADGLPSVAWENRILEDSVSASWFAGVIARSEEEVLEISERARQQPAIEQVRSVLDLVRADTPRRVALRAELAEALVPAFGHSSSPQLSPSAIAPPLSAAVIEPLAAKLNTMTALAWMTASKADMETLRGIAQQLTTLSGALSDPRTAAAAAQGSERAVLTTAAALTAIGEGSRLSLRESLPAALAPRLVSLDGGMFVSMMPREDIWEFSPLSQFVAAIRAVSAHATGVPITVYESLIDMRSAFILMSTLSLLAVAAIVWLDFRSIAATATCVVSLLVALAWTLGIMSLLGITLNLANFFGIPMLMGFGIDSSVHLMHRARETGNPRALGWTTRAVIVSAATTAIGFGTLLFASHQGLRSLGWLILLGTAATIVSSVILLPALLHRYPRLMGLRAPPPARV